MSLADVYADIALGFSGAFGAPYWNAEIIRQGAVQYDDGGSIIPSSTTATRRKCKAQTDTASNDMRSNPSFVEGDRRILVLSATLEGGILTSDRIEFLDGPFAGIWLIQRVDRDPAALGFELWGRQA